MENDCQSEFPHSAALHGRVALVSGATRGLGLEICRQLANRGATVVLGGRDAWQRRQAVVAIGSTPGLLDSVALDVSDEDTIARCRDHVLERHGKLDILVNNAGVFLDDPRRHTEVTCSAAILAQTLSVNLIGAYALTEAFIDSMRRHNHGRIVNVSSGMGRCVELDGSALAYRTSKAALNTLTKILSLRESAFDIKVNAVCPGWIPTDMGGHSAPRSVATGAAGVVHAASLPAEGFTGVLLRDGERFGCG